MFTDAAEKVWSHSLSAAQSGVCVVAAGNSVSKVEAAGCMLLHKSVGTLTALSPTLAAVQASGVRGRGG